MGPPWTQETKVAGQVMVVGIVPAKKYFLRSLWRLCVSIIMIGTVAPQKSSIP